MAPLNPHLRVLYSQNYHHKILASDNTDGELCGVCSLLPVMLQFLYWVKVGGC